MSQRECVHDLLSSLHGRHPGVLALLAGSCRDSEVVRFPYRSRTESTGSHSVAPFASTASASPPQRAAGYHGETYPPVTPLHMWPKPSPTLLTGTPSTPPSTPQPRRSWLAAQVLPDRIDRLGERTCVINVSDDSLDYIAHNLVAPRGRVHDR